MAIGKILGALTGSGVAGVTKSLGEAIDNLVTSDDEKLSRAEAMARIKQEYDRMQVEINKIDAQSKNIFQSGWRPFIGWTCGLSIAYSYLIAPLLHQIFGLSVTEINVGELLTLVLAMLGMSGTRTFEKMKGVNK